MKLSDAQKGVIRRLAQGQALEQSEYLRATRDNSWSSWRWNRAPFKGPSKTTLKVLKDGGLVIEGSKAEPVGWGGRHRRAVTLTEKGKAYAAENGWSDDAES